MTETKTDLGDNFYLICKPEQSGKTYKMLQEIIKNFERDKESVNFIFCANNLLLTKQTSQRIKKDKKIEKLVSGNTILFSSSKPKIEDNIKYCKGIDNVLASIAFKKSKNIICCSNKTRIEDVGEIVETLNDQRPVKINIWMDEADNYLKFIDCMIPWTDKYDLKIYLITATSNSIFQKYYYINVIPIENTITQNYHGWDSNILKIIDYEEKSPIDFIRSVLIDNKNLLKKNEWWYIPAGKTQQSHEETAKICNENGMAVFIINGKGIKLTFPEDEDDTEWFKKDNELTDILLEKYKKYKLYNYPIAITGRDCIDRGITLSREKIEIGEVDKDNKTKLPCIGLAFSYAILSNTEDYALASQQAGRVKGNMKDWKNYIIPTVFTTKKFNEIAKFMEERSKRVAELAYERNTEDPSKLTEEDIENSMHTKIIKEVKEEWKMPDKLKLIYLGHQERYKKYSFETHKEIKEILRSRNLNCLNNVRAMKKDDQGKFIIGYDTKMRVYKYSEILKAKDGTWRAKFATTQIKKLIEKGKKDDCIYLRWCGYDEEDKPRYLLKILYVD